jgi:hypothetical protein
MNRLLTVSCSLSVVCKCGNEVFAELEPAEQGVWVLEVYPCVKCCEQEYYKGIDEGIEFANRGG